MKKLSLIVLIAVIVFGACGTDPVQEVVDCSLTDLSLKVVKVKIADCGQENGEITIEASGGTPPYQYSFEEGTTQESNEFKGIGTRSEPYVLHVTDKNGCFQSVETFMAQKAPFTATVTTTYSGCEQSLGTITANPLNGVPPYTYQLGENSDYEDANYWEGLPAGLYSVWIKDDKHCSMGITDIRIYSGITFEEHISPIITNNCALAECHGGSQQPDFREFSNIQANAEKIRSRTQDKSMPMTGSLTDEEIRKIGCWVDDGAPDN